MAMTDACNQAQWHQSFLTELSYTPDTIPLHGDNKGNIDLALNPVTGKRSKHIAIKHHAIRQYVSEGVISLVCTPTVEMVADGLTKPLAKDRLEALNHEIGLIGQYNGLL